MNIEILSYIKKQNKTASTKKKTKRKKNINSKIFLRIPASWTVKTQRKRISSNLKNGRPTKRGTQREYSSKPLKYSIVKRILQMMQRYKKTLKSRNQAFEYVNPH